MTNNPASLPLRHGPASSVVSLVLATLCLAAAGAALAVPFHTPVVDGVITGNAATDWDPADLVANDIADDNTSLRTGNLRRLWCTWDQDNLYFAVTYQDWGADEALAVYVDLDLGTGPRDASRLDFGAANFLLPEGHGIDLLLARDPADSDAGLGGPAPTVRLVGADGATTDITAQATVRQAFGTTLVGAETGGDKRLPFWFNAEFALPWAAVYPDGMPEYAVIKTAAVITKGSALLNGVDTAPDNTGVDGGTEQVLLANLAASVADISGDGIPDSAAASISGTVTLPDDDGAAAVSARAMLTGFAGRDPGAALSTVTTAAGVRQFTLPRLPAGTYEVTVTAEGYLDAAQIVTVSSGQQLVGADLTLDKATAIRGAVAFAAGTPGAAGTVTLLDQAGQTLVTRNFTATGGPYVFFVVAGDYTVRATAATYLPAEIPVTVTAGSDVTGVDFVLERQTEISGTVAFASGPGRAGTLRLLDGAGTQLDFRDFAASGGSFAFFRAEGGSYTLSASAPTYVTTSLPLEVTTGVDVTGLALVLPRAALVSGTVAFEGPAAAGRLTIFDNLSGARRDTLGFAAAGDPFAFYLEPGEYRLELEAAGYLPYRQTFPVTLDDLDLGAVQLTAVRADHLEIVDAQGVARSEVVGTVSIPADGLFFPTLVTLAARDAEGRDDLYDLDANLTDFQLSARKMDDLSPPRGEPGFYADQERTQPVTAVDFAQGRAGFWMTDTAVEVLRVYLAQPAKDPIAGRIVVAFRDPQPTTVVLTADADTLTADGATVRTVTAQLFDSARNFSRLPDIPVTFGVSPSSTGAGLFEVATVTTNGDGQATATLTATGAGALLITAAVVIDNRTLEVVGYELDSGEEFLTLTVVPGEVAGWRLSVPSNVSDLVSPVTVTAQLIDAFGNPKPEAGHALTFNAEPADLGSFSPPSAVSDADGRAQSVFTPTGAAGLVSLSGAGGALGDAETGLRLRDVFVVPDPVWYDEPRTRQVFPPTDLTGMVVDNDPDALLLEIPFQSDWNGLQLHVIFETGNDAAGAAQDPFVQPVNYGHDLRPDYAITCKYSANDYGDFRRWNKVTTTWEWYDPDTDTYTTAQGFNIQNVWTAKGPDVFSIRIPWAPFGGRPASLRLEAYLTQDDGGTKRSAFDSAPQDSTLNLTFDYLDPGPSDWNAALGPVTLVAWSEPYVVKTDFPTPPAVTEVAVAPAAVNAGAPIILSARVTDAGDGVGDVLADLSAMGGGSLSRMHDDGQTSHGDATAGDGIYSLATVVPLGNPGGRQDLVVHAFDGGNLLAREAVVELVVTAIVEPIVFLADAVGDDHGPNQPGTGNKYYTYPTNIVFGAGSFDLTDLTIYETSAVVGGQTIDMIAFQVGLGDFPDPADPSTADWNPLYAEINIQKIDILIDNAPGGSTASLPSRQAACQPWDAWDYAIIIDGWYKAVVPSLGQNTMDSWRANALRTDQDILLLSDPELDTVTALVSKASLGDPTAEDIQSWDIAVCMLSHDGDADFGGVRWVNEARSEWQMGGGSNTDHDSNVVDLMVIPGTGHQPGLAQEDILDYESAGALARLEAGLTPVALEMSQFEDTGPPVIDTGGDGAVVTRVAPLEGAPLAMTVRITDDYQVDRAVFRYRGSGFAAEGWDRQVAMGALGNDLWVVDILPAWLDSNLVYSPVDSNRYLEFEIQAYDALEKTAVSPVTTLQILPSRACRPSDGDLAGGDLKLLQVDGSQLLVADRLRRNLLDAHLAQAWSGGEVGADTMGDRIQLQWDICNVPDVLKSAPQVPPGVKLDVFRNVYLATADSLGGLLDYPGQLPGTAQLSLHYPQAWVPAGGDEMKIGLYEYSAASNRWVLVGGNVTATGNNVTATIGRTGFYGLFLTDGLDYTRGEVISGISVSPNPFSPNGDGLYDDTSISFYLDREATVTVEIFNIQGDRKRVLTQTFAYAGDDQEGRVPHRVPGLIWDGRDFGGNVVPYGIYVLRIQTTFNQAGGTRTIRSNHSLAVIK